MKKYIPQILMILAFLVGALIFLYPTVSDILYERNATQEIETYSQMVENMKEEDLKAEWEKAEEYNDALNNTGIYEPFQDRQTKELAEIYESVLASTDMMTYLEIPVIDVSLPVYHGTSDTVLNKAIGHLSETSMPIGREGDHAVLTGHTGLTTAALFTNLNKMREGDLFFLKVLDETLVYEVDMIKVVEPTDTSDLYPEEGKDYVTLLTCTPYSVNSHRLLVRGIRTEYEEGMEEEQAAENRVVNWQLLIICFFAVVWTIIFAVSRFRRWKRKKNERSR